MTHRHPEGVMEPMISVSTTVRAWEDAQKVVEAIQKLFPDWAPDRIPERASFPSDRRAQLMHGKAESLELILNLMRTQRILDTALDAMSINLEFDTTVFDLSRQAAMAGKVAFALEDINLGGKLTVSLSGEDLGLWIEQQTWHEGRNEIPRSTGDELSMRKSGSPVEWFDKRGYPTINQEDEGSP